MRDAFETTRKKPRVEHRHHLRSAGVQEVVEEEIAVDEIAEQPPRLYKNSFTRPPSTIYRGTVEDFWRCVPPNCEIEPTVIPIDRMEMYWFHVAYVWGSHFPNKWMERKEVMKLSRSLRPYQSMRGTLIPRASTISELFPKLVGEPPANSLVMLKCGTLHYVMVWHPLPRNTCPARDATVAVFPCPNFGTCPTTISFLQ